MLIAIYKTNTVAKNKRTRDIKNKRHKEQENDYRPTEYAYAGSDAGLNRLC